MKEENEDLCKKITYAFSYFEEKLEIEARVKNAENYLFVLLNLKNLCKVRPWLRKTHEIMGST